MITCKELPSREFASKEDMFKALVENKSAIMALKKAAVKFSDGFNFGYVETSDKYEVVKANEPVMNPDLSELKVKVVMNTIGLYDSHGDVHIKDIWKRTLSHKSTGLLHLQEHKRSFEAVISNTAEAYVKTVSWKSLGADYEGSTQALIFESTVKASRNPVMFDQYKNGWVNNHSVGMQYVELHMCINSEERWSEDYKKNWDKYIEYVVNKEDVEASGYFWAVTEAKLVEGSAVLFGSNFITPTLENNMKNAIDAPSEDNEPPQGTQTDEQKEIINLNDY